jgi:hypothetical protein
MVASPLCISTVLLVAAAQVPQALTGRWSGNLSTSILGPKSGADFAEDFLVISEAAPDGSFYLRHTKEMQLFRIKEEKAQYCFAYSLADYGMAFEAPFVVNSTSDIEMVLCWRGERLPSHKAGCSGCECAQWRLSLDGDVLHSTFLMSPPAVHLQMDLVRSGSAPAPEAVRDGWNCLFEDTSGHPSQPPLGCPAAGGQRAMISRPAPPQAAPSVTKCVRLNALRDLRVQYRPAMLPCMPCDVAVTVSLESPEDGYVAIGFKDTSAAYQNSSAMSDIPNYLGMSTDAFFRESERWASMSGRILAAHVSNDQGCVREMRAEQYAGAPVDVESDGSVKRPSVQWQSGRLSLSFTISANLGTDEADIDWATGSLGDLRIMWAAGKAPSSCSGALGYHATQRALAPFAFPGYGEACEPEMLNTDLIV